MSGAGNPLDRSFSMTTSNGSPSPKRRVTGKVLFHPGVVVVTRGAAEFIEKHDLHPLAIILRHASGDWGEIDESDRLANEEALKYGERLLSVYKFDGEALWVITEADRSATTILLPAEY
jgi:hypothetical protein